MKSHSFATYLFRTLAFRSRRRKEAGFCEQTQPLGVCFLTSAATLSLTLSIAAPIGSHAATFTVTTTNDGGGGSLRQAILNSNAQPPGGTNRINFNISGSGPFAIQPTTALPFIVRPVIINGYSQPGSTPNTLSNGDDAVLMIELSGIDAGTANGLVIQAGHSVVKGLVINRFTGDAILVTVNGHNVIQGNFIGTDPSGNSLLGNGGGVHLSFASDNVVGGPNPAARNIISVGESDRFAVFLDSSQRNFVQGNYIGTDVTGSGRLVNHFGIYVTGSNNEIGGNTPASGNIVSSLSSGAGNARDVVAIWLAADENAVQGNMVSSDSSHPLGRVNDIYIAGNSNTVEGNRIGIDSGLHHADGIVVDGNSNRIGGLKPAARNVIVGHLVAPDGDHYGVSLSGDSNLLQGNVISLNTLGVRIDGDLNLVQGNLIGTDETGTMANGNQWHGIECFGNNNTIGGLDPSHRNIASGNGGNGITVHGSGNLVQGNYAGTDISGTYSMGNLFNGISADGSGNVLGGTVAGAGNLASGNGFRGGSPSSGIVVAGRGQIVQGNLVGTDVSGVLPLANQNNGIYVDEGANIMIGGTNRAARNVIAFNNQRGVVLVTQGATTTNINIRGNSIFANSGLGIDLGANGVTANDPCDTDVGPNSFQNFPDLTSAIVSNGLLTIKGTLDSKSNTAYTVEFFANPGCAPSGFGEGKTFIGSTATVTTGGCTASFTASFATNIPAGQVITATATDPQNNTSEFSACVTVTNAPSSRPTVTIAATDPIAKEPGTDTGKFTVTRTGPSNASLLVNYTVGGTATPGIDYTNLTGSVTIPAGTNKASIVVRPIDDAIVECPETVIARLSARANYSIGAPSNATVTILDKVLPTVTLTTPDPFASENGPSSGNFVIKRTGCTNTSLIVGLTIGGTASNGMDYQRISNSVTIRAGARFANILVKPIADALVEGSETVIARIAARSTYTVGSSSNATVTIADLATAAASKTVTAATVKPPEVSTVSSAQALTAAPWEVKIRGSDEGVAFLTFHEDQTLSGYGITSDSSGLCTISGTWSQSRDGGVEGSYTAQVGEKTLLDGTLTAMVAQGNRLLGCVRSNTATGESGGTLRLQGLPMTDQPDLSGHWLAEVEGADGSSIEIYDMTVEEELPGVFGLKGEGAGPLQGAMIATSRNRVNACVTAESFPTRLLSGNADSSEQIMLLRGVDQNGAKISIKATRQDGP